MGRRAEDLRKIDDRMTRDGESKLGLLFTSAFDTDHDDRASIQNGGERSDPRLVVVLRTKISEHGIREMALHQLGGGGGRAGTGIEERDIHLALGKRAVDEWQIADDGGEKSEAKTCFGDDQGASQTRAGNDVAETEGEKSRAAKVDIGQETSLVAGCYYGGPGAILHQAKAQHQANGPDTDENEERERAIETQHGFSRLGLGDEAHHEFPHGPGGAVKKASEAKLSRDAARENDGLERIPQHDQKDRDTRGERSRSWNHVGHCTCLAF